MLLCFVSFSTFEYVSHVPADYEYWFSPVSRFELARWLLVLLVEFDLKCTETEASPVGNSYYEHVDSQ